MLVAYNLLLILLSPIWLGWMFWRARQRKDPPNWQERFGSIRCSGSRSGPRIWFHAVSVGEVIASIPILKQLRTQSSDCFLLLSVTTSSGHGTASEQCADLVDQIVYFPIDTFFGTRRALASVRPDVVAIMETELWFNFLAAAKSRGCRTLLVNGRISDGSFRTSSKIRRFYRALLRKLDRCLMQTELDQSRILALGAKTAEVYGNSKFDQASEDTSVNRVTLRNSFGIDVSDFVVVIGSTRSEMEELLVLDAMASLSIPGLKVVHAPRHLERTPMIADKVRERLGAVGLRSQNNHAAYTILDTFGELGRVYAIADVVVIGGGFDELGGQNLLQPLAHGKPVLHGPNMFNFAEATRQSLACGASRVVRNAEELAAAITELEENPALREQMGASARQMIAESLGASARYAAAILNKT